MSKSPNTTAKLAPVHPGAILKETLDDLCLLVARLPWTAAGITGDAADPFGFAPNPLASISTPEPATFWLLGAAASLLALKRRVAW
jgi:hypothetical protein